MTVACRRPAGYLLVEMIASDLDVARLVEEHQAGIWRYLRFLGADPARAEDLAQETFLVVLEKGFEERSRPETAAYLRSVARNLFLAHSRRAARLATVAGLEVADRAWVEEGGDDDGREGRLRALRLCLEELPEGRGRQALELRYPDRRSMAEVADALDISEGNARVLLHRTRQALRRCLDRRLGP